MAEDFASIRKELNEALPFSFEEYSSQPREKILLNKENK